MSKDEPTYTLKLVMIGDATVGKSSLADRFVHGTFQPNKQSTMRISFMSKNVKVDGVDVEIRIWDTAGQEKYKSLVPIYYKGAHGALLVYDISNRKSLEVLDFWSEELKKMEKNAVPITLVGNKVDLAAARQVSEEEGRQKAAKYKAFFIETSALDNTNVVQLFLTTAKTGISYLQQVEKAEEEEKSSSIVNIQNPNGHQPISKCILCDA